MDRDPGCSELITGIDWDTVPKVELHLHLEGAIPHEALWQLVCKYCGDPEVPDLSALRARFQYRDFPHFIETWVWKNRFLREYEDFTFIAEAVARDLAAQRVWYAEVFFSPGDFHRHGLRTQGIAAAIRRGLDRVPGIDIRLIADLVRDFGPERADRVLYEIAEVRDQGILGIGLGGSEGEFPARLFTAVYDRARALGLRTTAHAGEAAAADSIWSAIRDLRVERIGHGTRAEEDPALVDYLAEQQIPLEMCPISNTRTAVVKDLQSHPIRGYLDGGLLVTLNTDDPKMFGNSLADELQGLENLGVEPVKLLGVILNGVEASWLSTAEKRALRTRMTADPAWPDHACIESR